MVKQNNVVSFACCFIELLEHEITFSHPSPLWWTRIRLHHNYEPGKEDSLAVINATQLPPNNAEVKDHLL